MLLTNGYQYSHTQAEQNFEEFKGIVLEEGSKVRIFTRNNQLIFEQGYQRVTLTLPEEEL